MSAVQESLQPHKRARTVPEFVQLECQIKHLPAMHKAVECALPVLLQGPPCSGKTALVHLVFSSYSSHNKELMVLSVGEQTDSKSLLGAYCSSPGAPGCFAWRAGPLLQAALEGRWLLIEDLHLSSGELVTVLMPLLDKRSIFDPRIGETVKIHPGFRLFATASSTTLATSAFSSISKSLFVAIHTDVIDMASFALLCLSQEVAAFLFSLLPDDDINDRRADDRHKLIRLANRIQHRNLGLSDEPGRWSLLKECFDCLVAWIPSRDARVSLIERFSHILRLSSADARNRVFEERVEFAARDNSVSIGRITLPSVNTSHSSNDFVTTTLASQLLEQIASAVDSNEPVLLVGETGTGKTTAIQHLASLTGVPFLAVNMSQQSEAADLLGGYRPYAVQTVARQLSNTFVSLFTRTFSRAKNTEYLQAVHESFKTENWTLLTRLLRQIVDRLRSNNSMTAEWMAFELGLNEFANDTASGGKQLLFHFAEGSLVEAIQSGKWILLDEINLATTETLNVLSGLLRSATASITLTERGDSCPLSRHSNFRLFAAMNPSTDAGKKNLPPSIRRCFTEIYVDETDVRRNDLQLIVVRLLGAGLTEHGDGQLVERVVQVYYKLRENVRRGELVDANRRPPLINLRSLSRLLRLAKRASSLWGIDCAFREAFAMGILGQLDSTSFSKADSILSEHFESIKNGRVNIIAERWTRQPSIVLFDRYVLESGPLFRPGQSIPERLAASDFVLTDTVKSTLSSIARAVMAGNYPVLLEGPTSSGKTAAVEFLAKLLGHPLSRINNHEHTDLQEYIGAYSVAPDGRLEFREGLLLTAVRNGHWLVLDELNLAPTEVLEALNRLLDDNRELYVPELGESIRPHVHFCLFATQNPSGTIYGGRKVLSRAFRSRFVEIQVPEIPPRELELILSKRGRIAPSQAKKLSLVFRELQEDRLSTGNVFLGRRALITLRDLFRWASRPHVTNEDLARAGRICLAERMRNENDKLLIGDVIAKAFKMPELGEPVYNSLVPPAIPNYSPVWIASMRRLFWLVSESVRMGEPVLLVGETGIGKTFVAELLAAHLGKQLLSVSCHQSTEASDLLGSLRPSRSTASALFAWKDGPLVQAMKTGSLLLLDEISLADDAVLERLNSVLETSRTLTLAEAPDSPVISAADGFGLIATMNPGGDYGKRELSPALRSRFTEIWVPNDVSLDDVRLIATSGLSDRHVVEWIVSFWQWWNLSSRIPLSLRDLAGWIDFCCNTELPADQAFVHGGLMLFADKLPTGNPQRNEIIMVLQEISGREIDANTVDFSIDSSCLRLGPFRLSIRSPQQQHPRHYFSAPTTFQCAVRLARALQLPGRAILLEGPPGVGKTSLITAMATVLGQPLVRINLSDQTDLSDLFGQDLPVDGGRAGEFAWRDGAFLSALKSGHWILLDELNLASQTVLEGLNACLDYRQEIYIPELDKAFHVSHQSRIFATQNPLAGGGGRKGLPRSFLNRFAAVWFEELGTEDYLAIASQKYPELPRDLMQKSISLSAEISELATLGSIGTVGRPWEFNLRDLFRWYELCNSGRDVLYPAHLLYLLRFRTVEDRKAILGVIKRVFDGLPDPIDWNISEHHIQIGQHVFDRSALTLPSSLQLLHCQIEVLDGLLTAVKHGLPVIIYGPAGSGKTTVIELAASLMNRPVYHFTMGPETDCFDLLGTFEQQSVGDSNERMFVWVDGPLLRAMEQGKWIVLDRANLSSPSVLDRLNGLLEPNGTLQLNEQGSVGNDIRAIRPHPDFRIFLSVGPGGEISRAMRNRGVELALNGDPSLIDQLAVMRAGCQVSLNSEMSISWSSNLREARISALMGLNGANLTKIDASTEFWIKLPIELPRCINDVVDFNTLISSIVMNNSSVCESLKALHRSFGFPRHPQLLGSETKGLNVLSLQGTIEDAACCAILGRPFVPSPLHSPFYQSWLQSFWSFALPNQQAVDALQLLLKSGCRDPELYASLWKRRIETSELVFTPSISADQYDRLLELVGDFQSIIAVIRGSATFAASGTLPALENLSPSLQKAFVLSKLWEAGLDGATDILKGRYMKTILEKIIKLHFDCPVKEFPRSLEAYKDLESALESDRIINSSIPTGDPRVLHAQLVSLIDDLLLVGDPCIHLGNTIASLQAQVDLQEQELTLQTRFIVMRWGNIDADEQRKAENMIQSIRAEKLALEAKMIKRDSTFVFALVSQAKAVLMNISVQDMSLNNIRTLIGIRTALSSCPPTCLDITVPIVSILDDLLINALHTVEPNRPAEEAPYIRLLESAVVAAKTEHPMPVPDDFTFLLQPLCAHENRVTSHFEGVREDEVVEKEIISEFFTPSNSNTRRSLAVNRPECIARLVSLSARPEKSKVQELGAELGFLRSISFSDSCTDSHSFFDHLDNLGKSFDFYEGPFPSIVSTAIPGLQKLADRVDALLTEWPDHDVLMIIRKQTDHFLSLPIRTTPLSSATIALELILRKAFEDWEPYAAKHVSLSEELTTLLSVVVEWRRIELSGWKRVSKDLSGRYWRSAAGHFIPLSMLIIHSTNPNELLQIIDEFVMTGPVGEFSHRLSLLSDLQAVLEGSKFCICKDGRFNMPCSLLSVAVAYFTPISNHLSELYESAKTPLESDLRAFLKTVTWRPDSATYFATRATIDRSHRKLAGYIRKCREILERPASAVLSSSIFRPRLELASKTNISGTFEELAEAIKERMESLQFLDDVGMKQRALLDLLNALKEDFGIRLTNTAAFEGTDVCGMLVECVESNVDPRVAANLLHQFALTRTAGISAPGAEDIGVRGVEALRAASGQIARWPVDLLSVLCYSIDKAHWIVSETRRRMNMNDDGCLLDSCAFGLASTLCLQFEDQELDSMLKSTIPLLKRPFGPIMVDRRLSLISNHNIREVLSDCNAVVFAVTELCERFGAVRTGIEAVIVVSDICAFIKQLSVLSPRSKDVSLACTALLRLADVLDGHVRSVHKLSFVCLSLFESLFSRGFCRANKEKEHETEQKSSEKLELGTGMDEGQGEKSVNAEMEFEEQLTGIQSQEEAERGKTEKSDDEIEMQQDFEADLEKLMLEDGDDDDGDEDESQDDLSDRSAGASDVDSTAVQQEIDKEWSDAGSTTKAEDIENMGGERQRDELAACETDTERNDNEAESVMTEQDMDASEYSTDGEGDHRVEEAVEGDSDVKKEETAGSDLLATASEGSLMCKSEDSDVDVVEEEDGDVMDDSGTLTRQLDVAGDPMHLESGVVPSIKVQKSDIQPQSSEEQLMGTKSTIHDILKESKMKRQSRTGDALDPMQLYEHSLESMEVVRGRSSRTDGIKMEENVPTEQPYLGRRMNPLTPKLPENAGQFTDTLLQQQQSVRATHADFKDAALQEQYRVQASDTESLAIELCEQLRLVLEPTKASRLKGDYRTGRRLNMRKIIPFIASDYRRDRIWLRRTRPSTRDYRIAVALDESQSMREGGADALAVNAVKCICQALTRLESGQVAVFGFGDSFRVHRPFHSTAEPSLSDLSFSDQRSDFCLLIESYLQTFAEESDQGDAWRLLIIISDGICQEHDRLRSLVNRCLSSRILPLLLCLDPSGSIRKMSIVEQTGSKGIVMKRYLETLPFEHYVIINDVQQLPSLLADALRQWFEALSEH